MQHSDTINNIATLQAVELDPTAPAQLVDREQIATFARVMFPHATEGFVAGRAFANHGGAMFRPDLWAWVDIASGTDALVERVVKLAEAAGKPKAQGVVCPPLATFPFHEKATKGATQADLLQGLALSIELDANPTEALAKLRGVFGNPTVVVESGGVTTEGELKLHVHYRLTEPATGKDLDELKAARDAATRFVGGDPSNIPTVHPIRWPGTPHTKDGRRRANIVELNEGAEVELSDVLDKLAPLQAMEPGATVELIDLNGTPRAVTVATGGRLTTAELVEVVKTGAPGCHDALRDLSWRYTWLDWSREKIIETLRGYMMAVPVDQRDQRWRDRIGDIGRAVETAEKNRPAAPTTPEGVDIAELLKTMPEAFRNMVDADAKLFGVWFDGDFLGRPSKSKKKKTRTAREFEEALARYLGTRLPEDEIEIVLRAYPFGTVATSNENNARLRITALLDKAREAQAARALLAGRPDWWANLKCNGYGEPRDIVSNAWTILREDPLFAGNIRFDLLRNSVVMRNMSWHPPGGDWVPWDIGDDLRVTIWMQQQDVLVKPGTVVQGVRAVANENPWHPVREYLDGLTWDGVNRLETYLIKYAGAEDTPFVRAASKKFWIGGNARVREPGCKFDNALILEGEGDLKKSMFAAAMAVKTDWLAEDIAEVGTVAAQENLQGKLLVELAELSSLSNSSVDAIKSFMSRRTDRFRGAYKELSKDYPRQCFFIGTTNKSEYLRDETGNRRFWPVKVGEIDLEGFKAVVPQLWAEADARYKAGEIWWLTDAEKPAAKAEQESRRIEDAWESIIRDWLEHRGEPERVRVDHILKGALGLLPKEMNSGVQRRVGAILRGWNWTRGKAPERATEAEGGGSARFWYRPKMSPIDQAMSDNMGDNETRASAEENPPVTDVTHVTHTFESLKQDTPPPPIKQDEAVGGGGGYDSAKESQTMGFMSDMGDMAPDTSTPSELAATDEIRADAEESDNAKLIILERWHQLIAKADIPGNPELADLLKGFATRVPCQRRTDPA